MLVITLRTEELEILQRLKPDIYDILATIQSTGKDKKTFLLPRDKAKQIVLISRNKHTISVWNRFDPQLRQKLHHFHRNFYNNNGVNLRQQWHTYVEHKHKIRLGPNLEILDTP